MAERKHIIEMRGDSPHYAADYAAWVEVQLALMHAGRWEDVDAENLIEEVRDLGLSEFKSFVSAIEIVLVHMLKWDHQAERRSRSWTGSIREHRRRIARALKRNPSYSSRLEEAIEEAYDVATAMAERQIGIDFSTFPETCPYSWKEITQREHTLEY